MATRGFARFATLWQSYRQAHGLAREPQRRDEYRLLKDLCLAVAPQALRPARGDQVAVIRLDNIGDFVLWLEGARAVRRRFPRPAQALTLIAPASWAGFAMASGLFDALFEIDIDRFRADRRHRRRVFAELAARRFGTVINPTGSRIFWADDCVALATLAPRRIANRGDLMNKLPHLEPISDRWYTEILGERDRDGHELDRNWAFAAAFDPAAGPRLPSLPPAMVERPARLAAGTPCFTLFVGASRRSKVWPMDRFAEIAVRLHRRTGWHAVVCGAPEDAPLAAELGSRLAAIPVENAAGRTTLAELAGVIAASRLVVTNDTCAVHIAAATATPAVCVVGGGHFGRFVPYPAAGPFAAPVLSVAHPMPCFHCNWRCVYPTPADRPVPCIEHVGVAAVWDAIEAIGLSELAPLPRAVAEMR